MPAKESRTSSEAEEAKSALHGSDRTLFSYYHLCCLVRPALANRWSSPDEISYFLSAGLLVVAGSAQAACYSGYCSQNSANPYSNPGIVSSDGSYHGRFNGNRYDPILISNPYMVAMAAATQRTV